MSLVQSGASRMYVCICNAVSDRTIRAAAASGASFEVLAEETGCASCCGSCTGLAHEIFDEAAAKAVLPPLALAAAA